MIFYMWTCILNDRNFKLVSVSSQRTTHTIVTWINLIEILILYHLGIYTYQFIEIFLQKESTIYLWCLYIDVHKIRYSSNESDQTMLFFSDNFTSFLIIPRMEFLYGLSL